MSLGVPRVGWLATLADLAFAFGCFHFGLRKYPRPGFTVQAYIEELKRALGSVANVNNVQIECDPDIYDKPLDLPGKPPDLNEGDAPYPFLDLGRVSFDLFIGEELQKELIESPLVVTYTERFMVDIHYMYNVPVVVVRLVQPTSEPEPSDAIVMIRRFLEREFERRQQTLIAFQSTGPSPVHADFYLTGEVRTYTLPWRIDVEVERTRGYDRYNFVFNEDLFADEEEAFDLLLPDLLHELDTFYLIAQVEREKSRAWDNLQERSYSIIELHRKRGVTAYFDKTFRGARLVNDAFISLSEFEGDAILKDNLLRDDYRTTYASDSTPYLQELVDRRMDERATYPTEQVARLLQLFEARRLSATELIVVLASAISGGAIGAVLTALIGGN
jgi:hypothetical protein